MWDNKDPLIIWLLMKGDFFIAQKKLEEDKERTYLDGFVPWSRHNFSIVEMNTQYCCLVTSENTAKIDRN
jgi:hypothetical protein